MVTGYPTLDAFAAAVGDLFEATSDASTEVLTLVVASPSGAPSRPGAPAPFSLLFKGATTDRVRSQGTYRIRHADLGMMDIFMVPVQHEGGVAYEAIFT